MTKRDGKLLAALFLLIAVLFAPLVLRPWLMPHNFGDLWSYHYPLRHLTAARLQEGQLPLWNPYIFAGVPHAANPQALLFYPLAQLHYFLPLAWAFSLDAAFHVLWAALGAYLLLRAWRLQAAGAALLAAAYALSPFLVYRVMQGVPTHLSALSWAPWIWLAALSRHPLPMTLAFALQVLSGHPQFALVNAIGLGLWGLIRSPRRAIALVPAATLGLFLAAAQVVPTLEYLKQSVRAVWNPGLALGYSFKASHLLTLLWPASFGDPFKLEYPSEFFEMAGVYIGLVPAGLAAYGLAGLRGRRAAAAWALVGTGLFFGFGDNNPGYLALQSVLRLDFLRVPARFGFLIVWGLWLAAAIGWRRLEPWRRPRVAAALLAATLLDLGLHALPWLRAEDPAKFMGSRPEMARLLASGTRMATHPDILSPNKTMMYRVRNATGYEAFYPARIAFYMFRSEGQAAADGSRTYVRRWDTPEMAALGVRFYLTPEKLPGDARGTRRGELWVYENPDAAPLVSGTTSWAELSPELVATEVQGPSALVVRQAYYPGWRAWHAGTEVPVALAEGLFAMASAPGPGALHLRFAPPSFRLGLVVTLVVGFMLLAICELRLRAWTS
ncbi:MAG: hypothetical protein HY553_05590 [Elusimicrobia bacterium]|nr:hypothetical protein [Elusimicrobiota bacterium]